MRLLENYVSVQGEGPNTGVPTRFLRFAGCNLRCPGWPCDTQHAIEPSLYSGKFENISPDDLAYDVGDYPRHICLTGGEPFLQKDLHKFIYNLTSYGCTVDIFTNGTIPFPTVVERDEVTIVMDWKLPGSGEDPNNRQRWLNVNRLESKDAIKFVVADPNDLRIALELYYQTFTPAQWWVGAAWGKISDDEIVQFVTDNELNWRLNVQTHKHIWDPEETLR